MQKSVTDLFGVLVWVLLCQCVQQSQCACPEGTQERLVMCSRNHMGSFLSATSDEERHRLCDQAYAGVACMRAELGACSDIAGTEMEQIARGVTQVEYQLAPICDSHQDIAQISPSRGRCTSTTMSRLETCATGLQRAAAMPLVRCTAVHRVVTCLIFTMERCSHNMEAGFEDQLWRTSDELMSRCSPDSAFTTTATTTRTTTESPPVEVGDVTKCPAQYQQKILACQREMLGMTNFVRQPDVGELCGLYVRSMTCLSRIARRCRHEPGLLPFLRGMGNETSRIAEICENNIGRQPGSVGMETGENTVGVPQPGGVGDETETSDVCPTDFREQLQTCSQPLKNMQRLIQYRGVQKACSSLREGLACLRRLAVACSGQPQVAALSQLISTNVFRDGVSQLCPS